MLHCKSVHSYLFPIIYCCKSWNKKTFSFCMVLFIYVFIYFYFVANCFEQISHQHMEEIKEDQGV